MDAVATVSSAPGLGRRLRRRLRGRFGEQTWGAGRTGGCPAGGDWLTIVVGIAIGVGFGIFVISRSESPLRWALYPMAGVIFALILLVSDTRKLLTRAFVLTLSLNVHYYITKPQQLLFFGNSSPTALSIPLVLFPAVGLIALRLQGAGEQQRAFAWGPEIGKPAIVMIAMALLSASFSQVRFIGLCGVLELIELYVIYLTAVNIARSDVEELVRLMFLVLVLQCIVAFVQVVSGRVFTMTGVVMEAAEGSSVRVSGTVGTVPHGFACFIEPPLFIALALFRTTTLQRTRARAAVLTIVAVVALILTFNRSSWSGLGIGVIAVEIICRRLGVAQPLTPKMVLTLGLGLGIVLAIVLTLPGRHELNLQRDYDVRVDLMSIAVRIIEANPVIGIGPGAYGYKMSQYAYGPFQWLYVVHNDCLLIWAERGTVGLAAWFTWLYAGLSAGLRTARSSSRLRFLGIGSVAALIVYFWEASWSSYFPFSSQAMIWFVFGVLVATSGSGEEVVGGKQGGALILPCSGQ